MHSVHTVKLIAEGYVSSYVKHNDDYPEDDWIPLVENWDLNLFTTDQGDRGAQIAKVRGDGRYFANEYHTVRLPGQVRAVFARRSNRHKWFCVGMGDSNSSNNPRAFIRMLYLAQKDYGQEGFQVGWKWVEGKGQYPTRLPRNHTMNETPNLLELVDVLFEWWNYGRTTRELEEALEILDVRRPF